MKTRIFASAFVSVIVAIATSAATTWPGVDVAELSKYVYPENKAKAPKSFTYMPDGQSYLTLSPDSRTIGRFDTRTGNFIENIFDVDNTRETSVYGIEGFILSPDASKILVYNSSESIYRRSFTAKWYVYEVRSRLMRPLSTEYERQRAPLFSPDSRMVAFVDSDNNIRIKKIDYNTEVAVTTDGKINEIINGVPDWVYEEEFTTTCSMAWSPDNLTLCYIRYDESNVPVYTLPLYEGACEPRSEYALYPGTYSYKYPVAGQTNSTVTLHSYDVETRKIQPLPLKDRAIEYVPRIEFAPTQSNMLIVVTLNREQNHMQVLSINPRSAITKTILDEENKAWITPCTYEDLTLQNDGFVVNSARTGYNHLYKYAYNGTLLRTLTSGDYDVTAYYGCDALGNNYYQAAVPTPADRMVKSIDKKGVVKSLGAKAEGTYSAIFDPKMQFMSLCFSDQATPPVYTLCTAAGKSLRVLEDNAAYASKYASLPQKTFFTMQSDGNTLYGYEMRPVGFDPSKKYPVIMYQYSGPDSQSVLNRWECDWQVYAAMHGYVIICVDGRGTGGRGRAFAECVYKDLGHYETIDQIAAARYAASLPYIDPARIGICGWSYGGYETLMCVSQQGNPYAAAVAIAPVTSWKYYDTVYTERYMLTPQANFEGYIKSAPINRIANVDLPLMIMYGTLDDNVHPANSIEFISKMQLDGKFCDQWIFPNMNHSILGCNSRAMVYGNMIRYFNSNL